MLLIASMEIYSAPNLRFSKMSTVLFRDMHGNTYRL